MRILASLLLLLPSILSYSTSASAREARPRTLISFESHNEYSVRFEDDRDELHDPTQVAFDVSSTSHRQSPGTVTLQAIPTTVYRPRDGAAFQHARLRSLRSQESEPIEWEQIQLLAPDVKDRHTLSQLARMAGNAYALPGRPNYEIDPAWNTSFPFGWEDKADGFRGHVFVSPDNTTVVLSIKGTTLQGPTSRKDKFNDNQLFSCCCARVDITWIFRQVCHCYANHWRCDNTCLTNALVQDSLFYNVGVGLVNNLTALYPKANIWLVGHSLGGSLASLLGTTFGLPAVAFEAPGERLAAKRLHLPLPPPPPNDTSASSSPYGRSPVTHVYHNADPIPQGACTGVASPCAQAGYALETRCHLGKSIIYDTVGKLGWRVDVRKHVIKEVITHVIEAEPKGGWDDDGRDVPAATTDEDCVDCFKWEFGEFKDRAGDDED